MATKANGIACFEHIEAVYEFAAKYKLEIPAQARVAVYGPCWVLQRSDGLYLGIDAQPVAAKNPNELNRERGGKAGRDLAQRFAKVVDMTEEQRALALRIAATWCLVHSREGENFKAGMLEALGFNIDMNASGRWTVVPRQ
mgnify:CR=1 FL=1